ncbi:MAG: TMEM175 family protein [Chitinophagales bacterium]
MNNIKFEKGRIISFTDAVFSIAMTLLVLEIAVPSTKQLIDYGFLTVLSGLTANFIGLVVSFFVTALYWIAHLRAMQYVTDFDTKLLWLNILMLLFIVLLPFSTAFYVNSFNLTGPFVFYCFNLSAIGLFNFLIIRYVVIKEKGANGLSPIIGQWEKLRALNSFLVWTLAGIVAFIFPFIAKFIFLLIFVFQAIINYRFKKKLGK